MCSSDLTESKTKNYIPILGQIPLIRYLFSYDKDMSQTDEMVIVITPRIARFDGSEQFELDKIGYDIIDDTKLDMKLDVNEEKF